MSDNHTDASVETTRATQSVALSIGSALLGRVGVDYRQASQQLPIADDTSVADVLDTVGLGQDANLLIVLNDTMVTRPMLGSQRLAHGDRLSLMPPIHAG